MATLVATLSAVRGLLAPLVTAGTLATVLDGPQNQINDYPAAEVRFGSGQVGRDPVARVLERRHVRTGIVRLYIDQRGQLGEENARLAPLIDAVETAFGASPTLGGTVDRFDATGNGEMSRDAELDALYVDVGWSALTIESDTYVQDW